ncbi:MAG: DinB family protein [Acidobacteriota bacterium]|nr:DinB family protein [Acidobacteriota bacterium]
MTPAELCLLLDYHYWARDRMLDALDPLPSGAFTKPMGNSFGSIRDTVVHVYSAEWIWLQRWHGTSPSLPPAELDALSDPASIRAAWAALESDVRAYVAGLDDASVNERVGYRNLEGVEAHSSRWTMLQHVVNHGSYHRGQVTTMIRQAGGKAPLSQDLIAFYRERGV